MKPKHIEIIINNGDKKGIVSIRISADEDFGLKQLVVTIDEITRNIKRGLLEIALENEEQKHNLQEVKDED